MTNKDLIINFYKNFSEQNATKMFYSYHRDILFEDPAFGTLKGNDTLKMWEMLLSNKSSELKISFDNVKANDHSGSAEWQAEYFFGAKKRKVVNHIHAEFKFKDGKIIEHRDHFNLWKWSRQALGVSGWLLGWTPFMKKKIQKTTHARLKQFIEKQSD